MTLPVAEFIRRFCLHFLPPKFVKIRHYGFLSNRNRAAKIQQARHLLGVAPDAGASADPEAPSTGPAPERTPACPFCGQRPLVLVESLARVLPESAVRCDSS